MKLVERRTMQVSAPWLLPAMEPWPRPLMLLGGLPQDSGTAASLSGGDKKGPLPSALPPAASGDASSAAWPWPGLVSCPPDDI